MAVSVPPSDSLHEDSEFFNSPLASESFYGMNTEDMIFNNSLIIDEEEKEEASQQMEQEAKNGHPPNPANKTASITENYLNGSRLNLKSEDAPKRRRRRKKIKNPLLPKKAPSAYLLWLAENRKRMKEEDPSLPSTAITKLLAAQWASLKDKTKWMEEARLRSEQYYKEKEENIKEKAKNDLQIRYSDDDKTLTKSPQNFWIDTLKKRKRKHDKYDEFVNPKVQKFKNLFYEATSNDREYFAHSDVSSLSEDSEWVLPKRIRKKKLKERKKLQIRLMKIKKKRDQERPKKPLTAYMIFLMKARRELMEQFPHLKMQEITAKAGELWNECKDKSEYEELANQRKEIYSKQIVEYERLKAEKATEENSAEEASICKDFAKLSSKSLSRMLAKEMIMRKRRRKKRVPRDKNLPKRPPTAFFLFRGQMWDQLKASNPGISTMELSKKVAELWKDVCDKSPWKFEAKTKREKYLQEMEQYRQSLAASQEVPCKTKSGNIPPSQSPTNLAPAACHSSSPNDSTRPSPSPPPPSPPEKALFNPQKHEDEEASFSDSSDSLDSSSSLSEGVDVELPNFTASKFSRDEGLPQHDGCSSPDFSLHNLSSSLHSEESRLEDKSENSSNVKVEMISPLHIPSFDQYYSNSSDDDTFSPFNSNVKKCLKEREEDFSSENESPSNSLIEGMNLKKIDLDSNTQTPSKLTLTNDSYNLSSNHQDENVFHNSPSYKTFEQNGKQKEINGLLPNNLELGSPLEQTKNKEMILKENLISLENGISSSSNLESKEESKIPLNIEQQKILSDSIGYSNSNQTKSRCDLSSSDPLPPVSISSSSFLKPPLISKAQVTSTSNTKILEMVEHPSTTPPFSKNNDSLNKITNGLLKDKVELQAVNKAFFPNATNVSPSSSILPLDENLKETLFSDKASQPSQVETLSDIPMLDSSDSAKTGDIITKSSHNSLVQTEDSSNLVKHSERNLSQEDNNSPVVMTSLTTYTENSRFNESTQLSNAAQTQNEDKGKSQLNSILSSLSPKLPSNCVTKRLEFSPGTHILKMQGNNIIISRKSNQVDASSLQCQPLKTATLLPSQNVHKLDGNNSIVLKSFNLASNKNENALPEPLKNSNSTADSSNQRCFTLPLHSQKKVDVKPLAITPKSPTQNIPFIQHILKVQNPTSPSNSTSTDEFKVIKPSLSLVKDAPHSNLQLASSLQLKQSPALTSNPTLPCSSSSENKKGYTYVVRAQNQPSQHFYIISSGQSQGKFKLPNGQLVNRAHKLSFASSGNGPGVKANIIKATLANASVLKQKLNPSSNVILLQPSPQRTISPERIHVITPPVMESSSESTDPFSNTLKQESPSKHG